MARQVKRVLAVNAGEGRYSFSRVYCHTVVSVSHIPISELSIGGTLVEEWGVED